VERCQRVWSVACEVVARGGRPWPMLLPTMIVGGMGEGSVMASLRLALAIAQNGNKKQHALLAVSGILVPISVLLHSALSSGEIYEFFGAGAFSRAKGGYLAGRGLESVRVATNVLTLPANPDATARQAQAQA